MKTFKKYLFWITTILTMPLFLVLCILEGICYVSQEGFHRFEGWCLNYKDTGLIYRGDGIWSSPHKGDK